MLIYAGIIAIALSMALILKKKTAETIPLAITSIAMLLYIVSRFGSLDVTIYVTIVFMLSACVYAVYRLIRSPKELLQCIFSPGLLAFSFLLIFFCMFDMGRGLVHSDDFTFWGYGVKYMYTYGVMCARNAGYPPVPFLWMLLANRTWIGFSEGICIVSMTIWGVSMLLPLYCDVDNSSCKIVKWSLTTALILVLPISLSIEAYDALTPDLLLSGATAYTVIYIYRFICDKSKFSFTCLFAGLFVCTFSKRIGIVIASLLIAVLVVVVKLQYHDKKTDLSIGTATIALMAVYYLWLGQRSYTVLPILMCVFGWGMSIGIRTFLSSKKKRDWIGIGMLVIGVFFVCVVFWGIRHENVTAIIRNYLSCVFSTNSSAVGSVIPVSLGTFVLGTALFTVCSTKSNFLIRRTKEITVVCVLDKRYRTLMYAVISMCVAYVFILGYLYLDIAPSNEGFGVYIPSFERYVLPCYYCIIVSGVYYLKEHGAEHIVLAGLATAFLLFGNLGNLSYYMMGGVKPQRFYGFEKANISLTEDDKIYFVDEVDASEVVRTGLAFIYDCMPAECDVENDLYGTDDCPVRNSITVEEWSSILSDGYTYVYLQTLNDEFQDKYGQLFIGEEIATGNVYRVVVSGTDVLLVKV